MLKPRSAGLFCFYLFLTTLSPSFSLRLSLQGGKPCAANRAEDSHAEFSSVSEHWVNLDSFIPFFKGIYTKPNKFL